MIIMMDEFQVIEHYLHFSEYPEGEYKANLKEKSHNNYNSDQPS